MSRTPGAWGAAAAITLAVIGLGGCGSEGVSTCRTPPAPPVTLSDEDRRDPVVASNGGGRLAVIWESLAGEGLQAATRGDHGAWSKATSISAANARDPTVTVTPDGRATAAWQIPVSTDTTAVEVAHHEGDAGWSRPVGVSPEQAHSREPQVASTGDGTILLVWRRDTDGADTAMQVIERPPDGQWTRPQTLSDPTVRSKRPRLAVAPDGSAALVWEQGTGTDLQVVAVTRTPAGRWSSPVTLGSADDDAHEPDVAIGPRGAATVTWVAESGNDAMVLAASRPEAGAWQTPAVIGRGSAAPYETPRPGRAETGAEVGVFPDGRVVAAWTVVDDGGINRASAATMSADGVWSPAVDLSAPDSPASGVQVTVLAGGVAAAAWEELDGGLIRARVARISVGGTPLPCVDLTDARAESGAVRLVGGSAPTAVFVDFNRSRVQATPIP